MTHVLFDDPSYDTALAIIGMSGKFPGAQTLEEFWRNLVGGVKAIRIFTDEELLAAGVAPADLKRPEYVKAGGVLDGIDLFDAAFFGYTPRDAEAMDPQHRLLLECAWNALEDAAYVSETYAGHIGIFAGSATSTYMLNNIYSDPETLQALGKPQVTVGNDQDSLTTMISYKLNLKGPSIAVQTFCSTSLVAVHMACQSLLNFECDMALAGGVAISVPQETGYVYEEGGILSPDGECRTFDAKGRGSVMGNGVGLVVLKRLREALEDGDHISAVIRGTAINNDGGRRVSYPAPGLEGQTRVVAEAIENADVDPESISYIEAHGTATELGDAIEMAALMKAFDGKTEKQRFCALGSVKPNVGHLDRAAGVTGLIKTVLALQNRQIPPSLNFERTSQDIQLDKSPFFVNTTLRNWVANGDVRRAGVSSFGVGGTNVHVVLEEAPIVESKAQESTPQLLVLSARTEKALDEATRQLVDHLRKHPELDLAHVAYTLQIGRTQFNQRRVLASQSRADAIQTLGEVTSKRILTSTDPSRHRQIAFLFPGLGENYAEHARILYRQEATFREQVDHCIDFLRSRCNLDIRKIFVSQSGDGATSAAPGRDLRSMLGRNPRPANDPFARTEIAQPALFVFEYALTSLLKQWGIQPAAMLGYSLGEYVAACVSGVLALEDALTLVATRASLIQKATAGAMLAVNLPERDVQVYLSENINLATIPSPVTCVLAGPEEAIQGLERRLLKEEVACYRVQTTHAFHSNMLNELRPAVSDLARSVKRLEPQIPYISNVTGTWITHEQAADPSYWARHMCETVRFADGIQNILQSPDWVVLEVGPGQALSSFVKQHPDCDKTRMPLVQSLFPAAYDVQPLQIAILNAVGRLWQAGVDINWLGLHGDQPRQRVSLPTYPFERIRYWVTPRKPARSVALNHPTSISQLPRQQDIADWFFLPSWKQGVLLIPRSVERSGQQDRRWLVFMDACGVGSRVVEALKTYQQQIITVWPGQAFKQLHEQEYIVHPSKRSDYEALLQALHKAGQVPTDVAHFWTVTRSEDLSSDELLDYGFYSILALAQALGNYDEQCKIAIVSNEMQEVMEGETLHPTKATIIGPCRVIPQEYSHLLCRSVDIMLPEQEHAYTGLLTQLMGELLVEEPRDVIVALRGGRRWLQTFEPVPLKVDREHQSRLKYGGVYLITGGLGGIGLAMAEHLAKTLHANLILTSRSGLPARERWPELLASQSVTTLGARQLIQRIFAMEAQRSKVLIVAADVSNEGQMRDVFQKAVAIFGTVDGILHAAGVPGVGLTQLKTAETAAQVLAPKVAGTLVLEHLIREFDLKLDFLALYSSMSSTTGGGPGQIDYSAANAFMDAYARAHHTENGCTIAIDWGEWQWNGWEAGLAGYDVAAQALFREHRKQFGITFNEGAEALTRILAHDFPHVVVSVQEFSIFAELSKSFTAATVIEYEREQQQQERYPRPDLSSSYVAPRNDLEKRIAAIWEELLGINSVGINDNFFELGGNSLTGIALMTRLRKALANERLGAHVLYQVPTVSSMALEHLQNPEEEVVEEEVEDEWEERSAKRRGGLQRARATERTR